MIFGTCTHNAMITAMGGFSAHLSLVLQELQSNADYAEVYTRSKWRQSRWAPSRIQQVSAPQYASVYLGPCTAVDLMFSLHKLGLAKACNPMQLCFCTTNLMQQQSSDIMHCEGK